MRMIFTGAVMSLLLAASPAVSQENTILNAMTAVVESEDGGEIAQGLLQIGATLTAMSVDETIAFRTSLILLHRSGQIVKGTSQYDMAEAMMGSVTTHLRRLCSVDKTEEIVRKVNVTLGRPFPCSVN